MAKIRVFHLAKKLGVQSELIIQVLDQMNVDVKSDLSVVEPAAAQIVETKLSAALDAERKRQQSVAVATPPEEAEVADVTTDTEETLETMDAAVEDTLPVHDDATEEPAAAVEAESPPADETPEETPVVEAPVEEAVEEEVAETPVAAAETTPTVETVSVPVTKTPAVAEKPAIAAAPARKVKPGAPELKKPRVFAAKRQTPLHSIRPAKRDRPTVTRARPVVRRAGGPGASPGGFDPNRPAGAAAGAGAGAARAPGAARPQRPGGFRPGPPPVGRKGRKKKKRREPQEQRQANMPMAKPEVELPPVPESITLSEMVTVKELAEKLNRKSKDLIALMIPKGVFATINQPLDPDLAIEIAKDLGSTATIQSFEEESWNVGGEAEPAHTDTGFEIGALDETRPPVVTVMGHVDHGKTSLLDSLREANVVDREHGGITQHIGAYQVQTGDRKITFLDTPGHEAFTLMRARGAKATDIVVLVVAADEDRIMPQTLEAIDHAKAAGVPLVVAINKIDKPEANPARVKQQLAERELLVEEFGGDVVSCQVSAKTGEGLDTLLEMILLVADLQEINANSGNPARGIILEARVDKARGIMADLLIQDGTLRTGDYFIAGNTYGKVRAMTDERGKRFKEAGPSTPVEIMGISGEPEAGDTFQVVADEARARQIASFREGKAREAKLKRTARRTLEQLAQEIKEGDVRELPILLKADVQGSIEALQKSLADIRSDKVKVNVLRASTGAISPTDVALAAASNAVIVGFNVRPDRKTADMADKEDIEIRLYSVIYDMVEDISQAMIGLLAPIVREVILGKADVRETFKVPKLGMIAGCYVSDGKVARNAEVRLLRDHIVIYTGKVGSLRRFKDDVSEVKSGYECGIGIAGYTDIKVDDQIEFFSKEEVAVKSLT
jgi:translation initiation factor IF-2